MRARVAIAHSLIIQDPIHGAYASQPNRLPWFNPGQAPAVISDLLPTGCNSVALFPQQANPWCSTIHVPKPEQLQDRDDGFDLGDFRLRGYLGPDAVGKHAYVCFAGDNGLGLVFWFAPNSLEHAFFNLGWAMHLVREDDTARGMEISKELVLQHGGELNLP